MPYKDKDDPNLPENVKKMADDQRAQWVAVFNSVIGKCTDPDPKTCESSAFAQANGVVKQAETPPPDQLADNAPTDAPADAPAEDGLVKKLAELLKTIVSGIKEIIGQGEPPKDENPPAEPVQQTYLKPGKGRAISLPTIYEQVQGEVTKQDPTGMIHDIYYDDNGSMFAMCASLGKLYRILLTIKDGLVSLGKWDEVSVAQSRRGLYHVHRTKEGRYRWVTVSASAVLNRVGEIDSRALFDDFIQRAEKEGSYPIRVFYHAGEKFRVGQCDYLARDENLLITSGLYDEDNELAMREIVARSKDPEYWGDSISFLPMSTPELLDMNGVKIPVYTKGVFEEISTLPEQEAASWFTNRSTLKEVQRMLSQRQMEAFVKLFDGKKEEAEAWLKNNAAERNRQIVDTGMITRAQQELSELLQTGTGVVVPPETPLTPETPPETPPTFELDETAMGVLAERVATKINFTAAITQALTPITDQLRSLDERMTKLDGATTALANDVEKRMRALEKDDETKRREWLNDAPDPKHTVVTFRPRKDRTIDTKTTGPEEVLSKLPTSY